MVRRSLALLLSLLILCALLLEGCQPAAATPDPSFNMTQAVQTAFAAIQQAHATPTPPATNSPAATPSPQSLTPPALPPGFTASSMNPLDIPRTYISDSCQYLKDKWTSTNAAPGTIVMVVMIHSIIDGTITNPALQIGSRDFNQLMNELHDQGFTAINMQQLAGFLYTNARIPARSVMLIQDDRKTAQNFTEHFLPFYQMWSWPVVNGWISLDDSIAQQYLPGNVALSQQGWVDYQAHGVIHNIPISNGSSDEFIHSEIFGSMQAIQKNFGKAPIAYIWPGGGFTPKAVQVARQAGFKLGFTTSPRGPLMFNWIPQRDQTDPQTPWYIAEASAADPLMTLPRYLDNSTGSYIDVVRQIGNAAAAYAQQDKATEMEYYNIVCSAQDGPIP